MPAHSEGELNPYAPPSSDAGLAVATAKSRRPASTKWALFLVGSGMMMQSYLYFAAMSEYGWREVLKAEPWDGWLRLLLQLLSFGFLFFGKPSPCCHIVVSGFLGKSLLNGVSSALNGDLGWAMQDTVPLWIALALLAWHLWAFAFGKASHAYYGVTWLYKRDKGPQP